MNRLTNKTQSFISAGGIIDRTAARDLMSFPLKALIRLGILTENLPDGWDVAAGGFPAMTGNIPFLMKDVVLFAASVYLLKQDVTVSSPAKQKRESSELVLGH